ncbi:TetR family transcriptional regulator [Haloactinopolyspora alba]|uniref:TetR family transcriptional regulator n=1 Tax=Haloactinopolyspora alba TaxID=648780 RepID=A0A2P8E8T6_9ACTN|nr:TetR/AcrR family transcriptional regulator [Haloactinopolyspora alba]PSL05873.1 TetR family transcriptional regulator [Haloactinopolyspora alba]
MSTSEPPADDDEPRRGRPRDPDAGQRILDAAVQVLLERGAQAMTVDAVAERAGVGKATVYRRWASKDDLAYAAVAALFDQEVHVPDTGSLLGDITEVFRDLLQLTTRPDGAAFFRTAAVEAGRDSRIAELYRVTLANRLMTSNVIFDRAVERGELDPDVDRQMLFDWPAGILLLRILTATPLPRPEDAEEMARLTLYGFARR